MEYDGTTVGARGTEVPLVRRSWHVARDLVLALSTWLEQLSSMQYDLLSLESRIIADQRFQCHTHNPPSFFACGVALDCFAWLVDQASRRTFGVVKRNANTFHLQE